MSALSRRQFLAASAGVAGAAASGALLTQYVWPALVAEDLIPGVAPELDLVPNAWPDDPTRLRFAAIGDNGSGGRQAMAVARQMAETYEREPFELVSMLGDISYYGNFEDRFEDVFRRPMAPLIDAGIGFELAIGNHDGDLRHSDEGLQEIEAELRLLGTPSRYYTTTHGPADLFYLDTSVPGAFGPGSSTQWEWLDDSLASSTNQWKIVALHHPLYSSGQHGSNLLARDLLEPILVRHHVDLVLAGHDHHYERTTPQHGITHIVSGGGCKPTPVGRSEFTAVAMSILQFLLVHIVDDQLEAVCVTVDGTFADRFYLRAREGR